MARRKFRLTGFARFFLVMIVLAPLAFLGASYYNGQDGIENLKKLFKGNIKFETKKTEEAPKEETKEITPDHKPEESKVSAESEKETVIPAGAESNEQLGKLQNELTAKNQMIEQLSEENETLKKQLEEKDQELSDVKAQLGKIKSAISQ